MVTELHDNYNILTPRRQPNGDLMVGFEDKDTRTVSLYSMNMEAAVQWVEQLRAAMSGLEIASEMPKGDNNAGT